MLCRPILLFVLACLAMGFYPGRVAAQVRHCVTPSGQAIFTDRHCDEVGAVERLPREQAQAHEASRAYRGGCARSLQDLVFEMTTAIDTHDANRLAGVYHWAGMPGAMGYEVWTRLDAIASRPLVDIVPVMPSSRPERPPEAMPEGDAIGDTSNDATPVDARKTEVTKAETAAPDAQLYPQVAARRTPVALRVEQTAGHGATPARTVFALTHYFGCWWVRF